MPNNILPFDWYLHLYHAQFGKIGFIDQTMSVYRRHEGGIWWSRDKNEFWRKHGMEQLNMYRELLKLFSNKPKYIKIIYEPIGDAFMMLAKLNQSTGINILNEALIQYSVMASTFLVNNMQTMNNLDNICIEQKNRIKALERIIGVQQSNIEELGKELTNIKNSKTYRTAYKLSRVKRRILKQ